MPHYPNVDSPLAEAISAICGEYPPFDMEGAYAFNQLNANTQMRLQDWINQNVQPYWATAYGVIEAAEHIVKTAVENGNIPAKGKDN